jgi:hypothetical protein
MLTTKNSSFFIFMQVFKIQSRYSNRFLPVDDVINFHFMEMNCGHFSIGIAGYRITYCCEYINDTDKCSHGQRKYGRREI